MKLKKLLLFPLLFFIFTLFFVLGVYFWWNENSKPASSDPTKVDFLIVRGRSASQVAQGLYEEGLIKNPLAFKIYVQVTDKADSIQAGRYSLSSDASIPQIVDILSKGPKDVWVTIPEGLRREEVVERFIKGLGKEGQEINTFRREFIAESADSEGFLFPDTYLFPREVKASTVVTAMKNTFDKRIKEIGGNGNSGLTVEEIVVLASIIERETKTDIERPVVAGILLNRLDIGMALQVDAATQYAVADVKCGVSGTVCDNWWPILTREDLDIDSKYNTYKYTGLPLAPISNPGASSLKAAIFPEDSDYLYYIHDSEGTIHYAKTLSEHNENIRKYLGK